MEDVKIKILVLWIFVTLAALTTSILYLMEPGVIEEIMEGEIAGMQIGHELLLAMAITYFWVPLVMVSCPSL